MKASDERLQQAWALACQLVAFCRFLPDREQRHARLLQANATRAYAVPMTANCSRCCGRHSTLAPTSSSAAGRPRSDRGREGGAIGAGQHAECGVSGHHRRARVTGAEQRGGSPRATASAATRIDAVGLRRSAAAGDSAISTTASAFTMRTRCRSALDEGQLSRPTRVLPGWRRNQNVGAASAPSTMCVGAHRRPWRRRLSKS